MTHPAITALGTHGLVPVVTINDIDCAEGLGAALTAAGLPVAEVTFRTDAAPGAMAKMAAAFPDMVIGAGTVLTPDQVDQAMDMGATFIVSPGLNPRTVEHCQKRDIPITPGICTPGDIERGLELGLTLFKFFPAGAYGGLNTLKAIAAPYTMARFMPTGGVSIDNLADYLAFDRIHACGGSWIVPTDAVASGDFDTVERLTRDAVGVVKKVRG